MPSAVHLMNAGQQVPPEIVPELKELLHSTLSRHSQRLGLSAVDVAVRVLPWGMPETGVHGYAPTAHYVELTLSPQNPNFAAHWREEVPATLVHELHHCKRWQGVGYGSTFLEVLVSEGLAQHHEKEERGGQPAMYSRPKQALAPLWERAKPLLDRTDYGHDAWFYGSQSENLPRWAGYALGYDLVERYMGAHGRDAAAHANAAAEAFRALATR